MPDQSAECGKRGFLDTAPFSITYPYFVVQIALAACLGLATLEREGSVVRQGDYSATWLEIICR